LERQFIIRFGNEMFDVEDVPFEIHPFCYLLLTSFEAGENCRIIFGKKFKFDYDEGYGFCYQFGFPVK
jgi:hypothetical protein